ncbi:alcohol dehydrogenase catalytic domain-containing protein [Sulfobacillus sp. DSM 109850]|uniref:Alcohol dehydrogenase catalytic domain-containing protein n=1 Tax=Sulfobacillus harzensis TaxID=2729629 RepID=A0A7Y0L147_9FIRM|nr:alcohol dehydrogenase catalytic domain-containing protein [Sulfobacillus harzensis]
MRTETVGICGSEVSAYLGHNELRVPPLVMGHEFSGRIEEDIPHRKLRAGDLVTVNPLVTCGICDDCRSGQRQYCSQRRLIGVDYPGAFASRLAVPPSQCYRVSDPVLGSLVEPLACAIRAGNQARITPNDAVLVIGAGIVGLLSAWVAHRRGARRVILADTNASRLRHGPSFGVDTVVDAANSDVGGAVHKLEPRGVDRVIDAVGFSATRNAAIKALRRGGRAVFLGLHENDSVLPGNGIVRDEFEIVGSFCYSDIEFQEAVEWMNGGALKPSAAWLDVRPASQGDAAFREQADGPAPFPKIVLQMS